MINKLKSDPKRLFLLDGVGAGVSAFMLGVVLVQLEKQVGIPLNMLYLLATLPLLFLAYDMLAILVGGTYQKQLLLGIAVINCLYCVLSLGLAYYHAEEITLLGHAYLLIEVLIVLYIAWLEYRVASAIPSKS